MKVFSNFPKSNSATGPSKKGRAPRPHLSDNEIREKLAKGLNKGKTAKPSFSKGKQVSEFMSGKPGKITEMPTKPPMDGAQAQEKAKDLMLHSDVDKNDPNDPVTRGKLKSVLKMGTFNFSDKEKAALSKILNSGDEA